MLRRSVPATFAAFLALCMGARAEPAVPAALTRAPVGVQAGASAPPQLTKQDLDAWLDGFMPYALARADIAGAVVVVVRHGEVLSEQGYGYADVAARRIVDPRATLVRPGSISKLFTWTAVMQLVEQGRLDLDADVNAYLDYSVPARDGRPITLRHLMTHTSGFEDRLKYLFVDDSARRLPLGDYVKAAAPARIYPPGEVPAYSNYASALAGYIVERVSGEPFETYIERHVFQPLGMAHSTFREPPPGPLAAQLSNPYERASLPARRFEIVGPAPAGALSTTGDDIARFMIAHLQNGRLGDARILQEATARAMHAPQRETVPHLKSWTLGFLPEDRNGHVIIAHDGDTVWFHSRLSLLLDDDVGVFISLNSRRNDAETVSIRNLLMATFMDRYFPQTRPAPAVQTTARRHAAQMAGYYRSSQREATSFLAVADLLMAVEVTAEPDDTLRISNVTGPAGEPEALREVGPYLWESATGGHRVAAVVRDDRVVAFGIGGDLYSVFERTPAWASPAWNGPLALVTLAVLAVTGLSWPVLALARRRRSRPAGSGGRPVPLHGLLRVIALVDLLAVAVYTAILLKISAITLLDDRMDVWLRTAQLLSLVGLIGAAVAAWHLVTIGRDHRSAWTTRLVNALAAAACVAFGWFAVSLRLVAGGTLF